MSGAAGKKGCRETGQSENQEVQAIVRNFLLLLSRLGIGDIFQAEAEHIQVFLSDISESRAKSMDQVISSLRKLDCYLMRVC